MSAPRSDERGGEHAGADAESGKQDSDDKLPPAPINKAFEFLFGLERYAIGRVPFSPGVSLVAVASLPDAGSSAS